MSKTSTPEAPKKEEKKDLQTENWTKICKQFPEANFLQSPAYQKMNENLGAKTIVEDFGGRGHALMIIRDAKRGRYLEIPCGPLIDWTDKKLARQVIEKIREIATKEKCIFVRIRPQLLANAKNLALLGELGLKKSPMHLAAEHTVMLDLTKSEEELMAGMRRQTRYEVRRAERLGVRVLACHSEDMMKEFHQVQTETAKRQNFVPPSLATLKAERKAFGDNLRIYVARLAANDFSEEAKKLRTGVQVGRAEKPIAYGLIIKDGREGDYYEAASTSLNRKMPGAYALLWQVIKDLKTEGYERFNLWGIAPKNQPKHRYAGVTTFKTGFGGEVIEYVPAHDLVISKMGYLKNLIVEKARKRRRHL